ncbi:Helix-hairpin-helix domain-containing protein [Halogeometricum limi]|uniref:Helix-hairpin-helix domain-containing protein n=2 Tax=Halogeometricum limi TaxID=555875 RepID=A0A1I6HCH4_9EURY|nr:Helix-hairpin-helix domain-containing protein [Halogeometricum limi]
MHAVTKSGLTVECANFKAIDGGVLLFRDAKRKDVCGYLPHDELRYVLADDVTTGGAELADAGATDAEGGGDEFNSELTVLGGLGETYARRLHDAGIDSLAAIRRADPSTVATAASVAESRAERWVTAAEERSAGESGDESSKFETGEATGDESAETETDRETNEDESHADAASADGGVERVNSG